MPVFAGRDQERSCSLRGSARVSGAPGESMAPWAFLPPPPSALVLLSTAACPVLCVPASGTPALPGPGPQCCLCRHRAQRVEYVGTPAMEAVRGCGVRAGGTLGCGADVSPSSSAGRLAARSPLQPSLILGFWPFSDCKVLAITKRT